MGALHIVYFGAMKPDPLAFDWAGASVGMPRVPVPCPLFGTCGGCRLQDLSYADQVTLKENRLRTLFASKDIAPERWLPSITSEPFAYRSRLRFSAKYVPKKGGVLVGFHERKKRFILDMQACPILPEKISASIPLLRECLSRWSNPSSIPQISVSASDNGDGYCIRHLDPLTEGDLELLHDFEAQHHARVFVQSGGYETIAPLDPQGCPTLCYKLEKHGLTIRFRPHHFTQVNASVNRQMLSQALSLLQIRPREKGLDLFCGIGNFTLALAHAGAELLGIDSEGDQIAMATVNASENALSNRVRFETHDLYTVPGVASLPWSDHSFALLDPPRSGALDVCRSLPENQSLRMLYVSCNPETLVRDAEVLVREKRLKLEALGLLDMFPQTTQAEAMAYFTA